MNFPKSKSQKERVLNSQKVKKERVLNSQKVKKERVLNSVLTEADDDRTWERGRRQTEGCASVPPPFQSGFSLVPVEPVNLCKNCTYDRAYCVKREESVSEKGVLPFCKEWLNFGLVY